MSDTPTAPAWTPGPLVELGITGDGIERQGCEVCNFIAIGPVGGDATAYVGGRYDALLYRAAPELLDALVLARKTLLVACGAEAPYIRTALKPIDAAIAKATGVQPPNNGDAK